MIGGNLSLEPVSLKRINRNLFPENKTFWLQCGRGGLALVIKLLCLRPKDEVLMPSYHCEEIAKPFLRNGIKCIYYPVGKNLQIRLSNITPRVSSRTKLIIIISYAGWPQKEMAAIETWCWQKEIPLLKDNVPLVPEIVKPQSNVFQLYSFRKYAGVPSGAALVLPKEFEKKDFPQVKFLPPKLTVELLQLLALFLGSVSRFFSSDYIWLISYKLYHLGEIFFDNKIRRISKLSYYWIERIDWKAIVKKRRDNANYLRQKLTGFKKIALLDLSSSQEAVPLLFPIITSKAKSIKTLIRKKGVFTTQLWHFPNYLTPQEAPAAYWLTNNILYLCVDQRYGRKEMDCQMEELKKVIDYD